MLKKIVNSILIVSLLISFQSCCTLLGHAIGKSMDEKSNKEVSYSIADSLIAASDSSAIAIQDSSKSNYKTVFAVIGAATDISLVVIGVMATSPMHMNLSGF